MLQLSHIWKYYFVGEMKQTNRLFFFLICIADTKLVPW